MSIHDDIHPIQHLGDGIKDDVLNSFCWMYSSFNIPPNFKGACAKKDPDPTVLYNTYYQASWTNGYLNNFA